VHNHLLKKDENKKENKKVDFKDVTVLSQNYFYISRILNGKLVQPKYVANYYYFLFSH
jgi:hypothetical protein